MRAPSVAADPTINPLTGVGATHPILVDLVPHVPGTAAPGPAHEIVAEREVGVDHTVRDGKECLVDPGVAQDLEIVIDLALPRVTGRGVEGHLEAGVVVVIGGGTGGDGRIPVIEAGHGLVIESLDTVPDRIVVRGSGIDEDDLLVIEVARVPEIIGEDGPVPKTEGEASGLVPDPETAIVNYHVGEV